MSTNLGQAAPAHRRPSTAAAPTACAQEATTGDLLSLLPQLRARLERLVQADEIGPARARELVKFLDRTDDTGFRKLAQRYVLEQRSLSTIEEEELWSLVAAYLDALGDAYRLCLPGGSPDQDAAVAVRALRACATSHKWWYLRYSSPPAKLWRRLADFYLYAEAAGLCQARVAPLPAAPQHSSPEQEFLRGVVLSISSPGGLLPVQIEIAERLIARCAPAFSIGRATGDEARYFIDLQGNEGPLRLQGGRDIATSARPIGLAGAVSELRQVAADIDRGLFAGADLDMSPELDAQLIRGTVRRLLRQWDPSLLPRRHVRHAEALRLAVVQGVQEVWARLLGMSATSGEPELWDVENRSESGLLALVRSAKAGAIGVGNLVAFRSPSAGGWRAAVVRRLERQSSAAWRVALETLEAGRSTVTIVPYLRSREPSQTPSVVGMHLPDPNAPQDELSLLLPAGSYSASAVQELHVGTRRYVIVPQELIEEGNGYQLGRFKLLKPAV